MVSSANADPYSPFQQTMVPEEGPQSSEEGSGLHSPVFGAPYTTHGDSFRYQHDQLDVHHSAAMIPPQYDYTLNAQQPPILDTLELPNSSARHVTFPSHYTVPPRNHIGIDFSAQSPVNSRIPPAVHGGPPVDYRYSPTTERRLPGGSSHDHSYNRPSGNPSLLPMESDHRASLVPTAARSDTSPTAEASTSSRETRKEISSVVIACRQCRGRKIRCDSTRPVCNNCVRRSNDCQYDLVPKRRGPDKRPGTRQRSCKKRTADGSDPPPPKRKRPNTTERSEPPDLPPSRVKENMPDPKRPSPTSRHLDRHPQEPHYHLQQPHSGQAPPSPTDLRIPADQNAHFKHDLATPYRRSSPSYVYDQGSYIKSFYPRQLDVNALQFPDTIHRKYPVPTSPSIEHGYKSWWDRVMTQHTPDTLATELTFLHDNTGHLLSFINLNYFIKRLYRDDERLRIQPAFILSVLAMSTLMKSSSIEDGASGMRIAMHYANDAHSAYEEAVRTGHVDASLAEAALILALFESSAYPHHSSGRAMNSLLNLDQLIKSLSLTMHDQGDRDVSIFSRDSVPMVLVDGGSGDPYDDRKCSCILPGSNDTPDIYSNHPYVLPWASHWTPKEIYDEEVRRVCWSALSLVSEYVAQCQAFNDEPPQFFLSDPSNFGLLFPNEAYDRHSPNYRASNSLSPKESVWALYCRSMLLWNFCNRFRTPSQEEERAEQAHEAFLEVQAIEDSLNTHRCNLDTTLIYTCREYIHNTRMLVAQALRSFHGLETGKTTPGPIFKRKQAEDWLFYQDQVILRVNNVIHHLQGPDGFQLTRRPFRINWFINQLAICLVLWTHDPTLDDALKLAKSILHPIDVLNALWPCPGSYLVPLYLYNISHQTLPAIQTRCDSLRRQLEEACNARHLQGPFPPSYSVPAIIRSS
uniref:Zn(2)-C6 fungal-type domain-containing protein n=1 Tax=Psilocybe cubensis TaxID=181762 RepID=A0A8H7Y1S2_PSICU